MTRCWQVVALAAIIGAAQALASAQTPLTPEEVEADVRAGALARQQRNLAPFPEVDPATSHDWPLHNHDLLNSRYAPLDQINTSNVSSLAVRWLYHAASGRATPVVAEGLMYVTTSNNVVALDAATGGVVWRNGEASGSRGAAYGDGKVYVANDVFVMALDARTGEFVPGFGEDGVSNVLTEVLQARYPELEEPTAWGYRYNMAPQYHDGVLIVGTALS